MDINQLQGQWVLSKGWLPRDTLFHAYEQLKKQPNVDLCGLLESHKLLDSEQIEQTRSAVEAYVIRSTGTMAVPPQFQPTPSKEFKIPAIPSSAEIPIPDLPPAILNKGMGAPSAPLPKMSSADMPIPKLPSADPPSAWGKRPSEKLMLEGPKSSEAGFDPGLVLNDAYEVLGELGRGGMGVVYRAKTLADGVEVAIKVAFAKKGRLSQEVEKRFKREILVSSFVSHENVIQVADAGEMDDGTRYMVMELLTGPDLKEHITAQGALPVEQALDFIEQALKGLKACHDQEIVHRDFKPENLRLVNTAGRSRIVLTDFGLSRLITEEEIVSSQVYTTQKQTVSGSPAYMAPESITEPGKVDFRCDLYSVGVTLFELLTGGLPFTARSAMDYLTHHLYSAVPRLEERVPGNVFPDSVEAFIRKLMEKERDLRFQNCDLALEFLQRVRADCLQPRGAQSMKKPKRKKKKRSLTRRIILGILDLFKGPDQ